MMNDAAMQPEPWATIRRRGWSPKLALPTLGVGELVAVSLAIILAGVTIDDAIGSACLFVLWLGYKLLVFPGSTPVLFLAFAFQWLQVSVGVFYYGWTGRELITITSSEYRPMVLIGLGCVACLAIGLRLGAQLVWRNRPPDEIWPEEAVSWPVLVGVYIVMLSSETAIRNFAWDYPSITQAVLAVDMARLGVLFLLFRRLTNPVIRWNGLALILGLETVMGLIGYFAGFREPIVLLMLALLEIFDRRNSEHRLALGGLIAIGAFLGVLWMGIRTEYREKYTELDTFDTDNSQRLGDVRHMSSQWARRDGTELATDVDKMVDRIWAVYYPALAVQRVPAQVPHTDGTLMWGVLEHLVTPRIIFPEKKNLPSNSELVRKYSGVWVAGEEHSTSIAFGYAAESWVDFGAPLMFVPMLIFATFMGAAYALMMNYIYHRELAVALTTVVFWLSLYLFERSWAKMVGDALTLMVYLGSTTYLVDRLFLTQFVGSHRADVESPAT